MIGPGCELPDRFDSFQRYEKKAIKLREHIELELEERCQADNVINFFLQQSNAKQEEFLDDDKFYQPITQQPNDAPSSRREPNFEDSMRF